ncbi:hypothetical protein So717_03250 [Roseobacter cerasinus]|uniref:Uncharacterized protein n=1 Tax=Roseobacter cerasinus TaxID=2602289 RepID=A0A640VLI8_9RHOB|nr:hypothetical protein So717_03250 [Roseobacter cerasinus]
MRVEVKRQRYGGDVKAERFVILKKNGRWSRVTHQITCLGHGTGEMMWTLISEVPARNPAYTH